MLEFLGMEVSLIKQIYRIMRSYLVLFEQILIPIAPALSTRAVEYAYCTFVEGQDPLQHTHILITPSILSMTLTASDGGARGVVVIAVGNEHGDTSSNPGRDWLHFT